jgi:phenylalanyl-tRNA synthetase alpha chain
MGKKLQQYEEFLKTYDNDFIALDTFHKPWMESVKSVLSTMKSLTKEEKTIVAPIVMEQKKIIEEFYEKQKQGYKQKILQMEDSQPINKYIYRNQESYGSTHPITDTLLQLTNIMESLGFCFKNDGLMVTEKQNFDDLNVPQNHSARDMQDTFFLNNGLILRTHTSTTQIRVLKEESVPIKFFSMGQVFRNEAVDATHNSMFHQMEVVYINEDANVLTLRGTIETILKKIFHNDISIRFRCSFFPFTTPSFEIDMEYNGHWLEIGGCGMIHPHVMDNVKNPNNYQGFAMGFGVDRIHMIKHNLKDIRDLYVHQSHLYKGSNGYNEGLFN